MVPTLLVGDYLFVSKFSYGYSRYSLPFGLPLIRGRPHLLPRAAARRRHRVQAALPVPATDSAGDRPDQRARCDTRSTTSSASIGLPGDTIQMNRACSTSTTSWCRASRPISAAIPTTRAGGLSALHRDAAQRACKHCIIRTQATTSLARQHRRVHRAGRPLFHDGRQSRQFRRQPRSRQRRRLSCRPRISSAAPNSSSSRPTAMPTGGRSGAGRSRSATTGCSTASV